MIYDVWNGRLDSIQEPLPAVTVCGIGDCNQWIEFFIRHNGSLFPGNGSLLSQWVPIALPIVSAGVIFSPFNEVLRLRKCEKKESMTLYGSWTQFSRGFSDKHTETCLFFLTEKHWKIRVNHALLELGPCFEGVFWETHWKWSKKRNLDQGNGGRGIKWSFEGWVGF